MKKQTRRLRACFRLGLAGLFSSSAFAVTEAEATAGRLMVERHVSAVINVEVTATIRLDSKEGSVREQKSEVNGTVVAPWGLTVVPLSAVDQHPVVISGDRRTTREATTKDIKLRFPDGTERAGKLVAKDSHAELALVAPDGVAANAGERIGFVDFGHATEAALLSSCILVGRTPSAYGSLPLVRICYVMGRTEKPAYRYILPEPCAGVPAYALSGEIVGLATSHVVNGRVVASVVVPSSEVIGLIQRAIQKSLAPSDAP